MYIAGSRLLDNRTGRTGTVDSVERHHKGILHRVHFDDGQWGSYYETKLNEYFTPLDLTQDEIDDIRHEMPVIETVLGEFTVGGEVFGRLVETRPAKSPTYSDERVCFLNFNTGEQFADRPTWLYWLKMRRM